MSHITLYDSVVTLLMNDWLPPAVSNCVPLSHWNCGYEAVTHKCTAQSSASMLGYFMAVIVRSFIGRHSNSILTVSNEMIRQNIVKTATAPCVYARAVFVRYMLALMHRR